jgi:hypothetical protein
MHVSMFQMATVDLFCCRPQESAGLPPLWKRLGQGEAPGRAGAKAPIKSHFWGNMMINHDKPLNWRVHYGSDYFQAKPYHNPRADLWSIWNWLRVLGLCFKFQSANQMNVVNSVINPSFRMPGVAILQRCKVCPTVNWFRCGNPCIY